MTMNLLLVSKNIAIFAQANPETKESKIVQRYVADTPVARKTSSRFMRLRIQARHHFLMKVKELIEEHCKGPALIIAVEEGNKDLELEFFRTDVVSPSKFYIHDLFTIPHLSLTQLLKETLYNPSYMDTFSLRSTVISRSGYFSNNDV